MASDAGLAPLIGKRDIERVKEMLKQAGYAGEKGVMLIATDFVQMKAMGDVMADQLGMNVDYVYRLGRHGPSQSGRPHGRAGQRRFAVIMGQAAQQPICADIAPA